VTALAGLPQPVYEALIRDDYAAAADRVATVRTALGDSFPPAYGVAGGNADLNALAVAWDVDSQLSRKSLLNLLSVTFIDKVRALSPSQHTQLVKGKMRARNVQ